MGGSSPDSTTPRRARVPRRYRGRRERHWPGGRRWALEGSRRRRRRWTALYSVAARTAPASPAARRRLQCRAHCPAALIRACRGRWAGRRRLGPAATPPLVPAFWPSRRRAARSEQRARSAASLTQPRPVLLATGRLKWPARPRSVGRIVALRQTPRRNRDAAARALLDEPSSGGWAGDVRGGNGGGGGGG